MRLPCLSRSGTSSPLGKLTAVQKLRLAEPTDAKLREIAAGEGVPVSEFLRVLVEVRVHGVKHAEKIAAAQIRRVAGVVDEIDHTKLQ